MELFDRFVQKGLIDRLKNVVDNPFARITYTEAVEILEKSGQKFEFPIHWGCDMQSEHERYLCEQHFKRPLIVHDYPETIKPFYMRNNDDGKTVAAMDVLVPGVGEIIGGSQREERLDLLTAKMDKHELDKESYWWYLELRKFGSVPHAGFGAGFERLVLFATGMENIRDVIPFPRYPGHAEF
ncbi:MAG: Asparagine--tRNA ligase [Chlamydiae bacterium]|nr:Asparagine--tRNA ligase [Chlamydiota bacterium]